MDTCPNCHGNRVGTILVRTDDRKNKETTV
jgi:hypothetical protein